MKLDNTTLIELLLCLAILSLGLYPAVFLIHLSAPTKFSSQNEYLGTLLAHHAMETLIAKKALNPNYLPQMAKEMPVVAPINSAYEPHEFFKDILQNKCPLNENTDAVLFWAFKPFNLSIDTYLLDNDFYKVICKINYIKNQKTMNVFFERLLHIKKDSNDDTAN